jgi:hypothetical protein
VIVTPHPEVLVWERCPGCKSHIWDTYDLMLAEVTVDRGHQHHAALMM